MLPAPRRLPGRLRLESAVPCSQAFDDPDWRFSVDWDGARALLIWGGAGGVRLQGETSSDLTARYPELQAAADTLGERACVIEGVVGPRMLQPDEVTEPAQAVARRRGADDSCQLDGVEDQRTGRRIAEDFLEKADVVSGPVGQ